jgi:hypothetical protein
VGNFRRDLAVSQLAVNALITYYEKAGHAVKELEGKEEQKKGDFSVELCGIKANIEVKFDMYAQRSGNLCFEMSNGSKPTGIMTTQADLVHYVVPKKEGYTVYVFKTSELRDYIQDSSKVKIKNGGDKKKFILALAQIDAIMLDELPTEVFEIA